MLDHRHYAVQYRNHREWKAGGAIQLGNLDRRTVSAKAHERVGKEAATVDTQRPIDQKDLSIQPTSSSKSCESCGRGLTGRQSIWCSEPCRSRSRLRGP